MINLEFIANEIQFARKAWNVYFWSCWSNRSGFEVEHEHQELFISNLYPAILVCIIESESTGQSLQIQSKEIVMDSDNYSILSSVILMCTSEYKSMNIPLSIIRITYMKSSFVHSIIESVNMECMYCKWASLKLRVFIWKGQFCCMPLTWSTTQHWMKSSKATVPRPCLSNFLISIS